MQLADDVRNMISEIKVVRGENVKIPLSSGTATTVTIVSGYGLFISADRRTDIELKPGHVLDMTRWSTERGWQLEATGSATLVAIVTSVKYDAR